MDTDIILGLAVPFIGTTLGAACVFFMKKTFGQTVSRILSGFAAGVMTAASVWSLIIPSIERSQSWGRLSFVPALIGFWTGVLFLLLLDKILPQFQQSRADADSTSGRTKRTAMMVLAVTIHNIPEGMAVGVIYAGLVSGCEDISAGGALALALGIAIQNIPEGAIISMPLRAEGRSKLRAFNCGMLSGAVEPIFGALTLLLAGLAVPAMPYLLAFAAGAMIYVVVTELIPEMSDDSRPYIGVISFAMGFTLMMSLDVALG